MNSPEKLLEQYKRGGDRYDLVYAMREFRDQEIPRDQKISRRVWTGMFSHRETGEPIEITTLVGDDVDVQHVASLLCFAEGDYDMTYTTLFVLDEEIVLFVAYDTSDEEAQTLVLRCDRARVETLLRSDALAGNETVLPTSASGIGGSTGFREERIASYMPSFEPDADGLWNGKEIVAWSGVVESSDYYPCDDISLDPPRQVQRTRYDGSQYFATDNATGIECYDDVAYIALEGTIAARGGTETMTANERLAARFYADRLCSMYKDLDVGAFPAPGASARRHRRVSHALLRTLVQRQRAIIAPVARARVARTKAQRDARGAALVHAFLYDTSTELVFKHIRLYL